MTIVTIETRLDARDVRAMRDFLRALADGAELPWTTSRQGKARQRCRRNGWATCSGRTWEITEAGRDWLKGL